VLPLVDPDEGVPGLGVDALDGESARETATHEKSSKGIKQGKAFPLPCLNRNPRRALPTVGR
jgi:hypothetical protein